MKAQKKLSSQKPSDYALRRNINKNNKKHKQKAVQVSALVGEDALQRSHNDPSKRRLLTVAHKYCSCSSSLQGNERLNTDTQEQQVKISKAYLCKTRLCPICEKNMTNKNTPKLLALLKALEGENLVLLTLTVPNVHYTELRPTVDRMNLAYKAFVRKHHNGKSIKKIIKGYYRKLEVTVEKKRPDYLHPHFHCLLHLNKSYFQGDNYIKRDLWLQYWQECYGDNTITQVDVRRIKADKKTAKEIAKYTAKPLKNPKPETLANFVDAMVFSMKHRRFISKGGTIRKLMAEITKGQTESEQAESWENLSEFFASYDREKMRYEVIKYRLL